MQKTIKQNKVTNCGTQQEHTDKHWKTKGKSKILMFFFKNRISLISVIFSIKLAP